MSARDLARVLAGARLLIGAGLLAAPRLSLGMWLGRDTATPSLAPVGRALGVREVVLGAMALHTLDRPEVARRWLRTLAAIDAVDLAATLAAGRALPAPGRVLIAAMAGTGAAGQAWAAAQLTTVDPSATRAHEGRPQTMA
jgi:hypothetical protein